MAKYTIVTTDDVSNFSQNGEMRMMGQALGSDQIALTYRQLPAGYASAHGHTHSKMDEIIFVYAGTLQLKLEDEIVEIGPKTAVRISPDTKRGYHNQGSVDVQMIIVSPQGTAVGDNGGIPDENWWK